MRSRTVGNGREGSILAEMGSRNGQKGSAFITFKGGGCGVIVGREWAPTYPLALRIGLRPPREVCFAFVRLHSGQDGKRTQSKMKTTRDEIFVLDSSCLYISLSSSRGVLIRVKEWLRWNPMVVGTATGRSPRGPPG